MPLRTFRLTLRVKRAPIEFAEGLGIGVLATTDVSFDIPDNYSTARLEMSLSDQQRLLIDENIEVLTEEVK